MERVGGNSECTLTIPMVVCARRRKGVPFERKQLKGVCWAVFVIWTSQTSRSLLKRGNKDPNELEAKSWNILPGRASRVPLFLWHPRASTIKIALSAYSWKCANALDYSITNTVLSPLQKCIS